MFTNKHVVIALLIAPVLAIVSYFAVDLAVREQPQAAQAGVSYSLAEKSNCRYTSGACDLVNGNFSLRLTPAPDGGSGQWLQVHSQHPLSGGRVAIVAADSESAVARAIALQPLDSEGLQWRIPLPANTDADTSQLQLAVAAAGSVYFVETHLRFLDYRTSYAQDFRPID